MQRKRHIGKIKNTDQRCVVVFMQLPEDENNALVVQVGNLPPMIEDLLNDVVESREAQAEPTLANILHRRFLTTDKTLLQALHELGLLQVQPIDNIVMTPRPNEPIPLRDVINAMKATADAELQQAVERFNPYTNNGQALTDEQRLSIARNLLIEAELLEQDAKAKREQAYMYYPKLRPGAEDRDAPKSETPAIDGGADETVAVVKRTRSKNTAKAKS